MKTEALNIIQMQQGIHFFTSINYRHVLKLYGIFIIVILYKFITMIITRIYTINTRKKLISISGIFSIPKVDDSENITIRRLKNENIVLTNKRIIKSGKIIITICDKKTRKYQNNHKLTFNFI